MRKKSIIVILTVTWVLLFGIVLNVFLEDDTKGEPIHHNMQHFLIEEFNSTFSSYQGEQTGSQVKALLGRLVGNAYTYSEEPSNIPSLSYNSNGDTDDKNSFYDKTYCEVTEEDNTHYYCMYLSEISKNIDSKHSYYITMSTNSEGRIKGITINYDKMHRNENFESKFRLNDGIVLFSSETDGTNSNDNIDKEETVVDSEHIQHNMSAYQVETLNQNFIHYPGTQSGAVVKSLLDRLISNANTYSEEPFKIPFVCYNSNGDADDKNSFFDKTYCEVTEENNTHDYVNYINGIKKHIDLKHSYNVNLLINSEGIIKVITINYNSDSENENFEVEFKPIDGISLFSSESDENSLEDNKDK